MHILGVLDVTLVHLCARPHEVTLHKGCESLSIVDRWDDRWEPSQVRDVLILVLQLLLHCVDLAVVEDGEADLLAAWIDHDEQTVIDDVHARQAIEVIVNANV